MERIKTLETRDLNKSVQTGGCDECPTSSPDSNTQQTLPTKRYG